MKNLNVIEQKIIRNQLILITAIDRDGLILRNLIGNKEEEIRFLGIDAPEIKKC